MKLKLSHFQILLLLMLLNGCANLPSHLIISPDNVITPAIFHANKQAQLNVIDMRTANHVVQIIRKGEAATLLSTQERLEETIKKNLSKHWKKQNLDIQPNGLNAITVAIEKAVISVVQERVEYQVQTEIVLKITINNGSQTLTTTFNNRGNSDGPLQADIAVLERNFNQRLEKILEQVLANKKISNFLK
jgi:uncharacterized lipoprotein